MKYLLILLFWSCTKEYSLPANEINLTLQTDSYTATVNGSTGKCWKLTLTANKSLTKDYFVHYSFDDLPNMITISHIINANSTSNIAYTQIFVKGSSSNVNLIKVVGADGYKFSLK